MSTKHAMVVGCGSVGSAVAEMLVRAGIGNLTIVDPETLEPENIGRHLLTQKDLGRPKAEAMKERLLAVNPECAVSAWPRTFEEYLARPKIPDLCEEGHQPLHLVLSCVDSYRCESLINGYALETGIPAIYLGCWGPAALGEILYVVPGKTACYECFASFRKNVEIPADARKYTDPDFDDTRIPGQPGLWANILAISGIAFQVILGLFELRPEVIDCEHTLWLANICDYDSSFRPLAVTFAKVKKGCAVCDESLLLGMLLAGVILGAALLEKLLGETAVVGASLFVALLLVSPLAYVLRKACRRKLVRHPIRRARERTRIAADHFAEE